MIIFAPSRLPEHQKGGGAEGAPFPGQGAKKPPKTPKTRFFANRGKNRKKRKRKNNK